MSHYTTFARQGYSQNGEEGIIAQLVAELGIGPDHACEFGAMDGKTYSNTYALIECGWKGLYLETDARYGPALQQLARRYSPRLEVSTWHVGHGPGELDGILREYAFPGNFGVLSIDIEGNDYYVWKELAAYRPKIVVIEVDGGFACGRRIVQKVDWAPGRFGGASFSSLCDLARSKQYLVAAYTGNLICVAEECGHLLSLPASERENPDLLYDARWYDPASESYQPEAQRETR